MFPSLVQADRILLNQIPSLVLQNTREFQHLWTRPQEDTEDSAATAVTHSRESGVMVWLHPLWSHRYTQGAFASEPPPRNESIAGINPTVLLLNGLGKLPRESATLGGCEPSHSLGLISRPFSVSSSHQHKDTECLKRLLDKQVVFGKLVIIFHPYKNKITSLEGALGWGIRVNRWLMHVNVWQKPLHYCKVISLQLIKINGKKIRSQVTYGSSSLMQIL